MQRAGLGGVWGWGWSWVDNANYKTLSLQEHLSVSGEGRISAKWGDRGTVLLQ